MMWYDGSDAVQMGPLVLLWWYFTLRVVDVVTTIETIGQPHCCTSTLCSFYMLGDEQGGVHKRW